MTDDMPIATILSKLDQFMATDSKLINVLVEFAKVALEENDGTVAWSMLSAAIAKNVFDHGITDEQLITLLATAVLQVAQAQNKQES
jgi:hypothetical protein